MRRWMNWSGMGIGVSLSYFTRQEARFPIAPDVIRNAACAVINAIGFRCKSGQKHAVAIAEKTVSALNRMVISSQYALSACKCAHQHQQARLRQVKIRQQSSRTQ